MTRQRRRDEDDEELRNDPDFRALVEELRSQAPEQRERFEEWMEEEITSERSEESAV